MGLPIPRLDDKNFDEILSEARSLLSLYTKEWTDHNVHDPGITFIELFAWIAEMQIYQLDRITDGHYLTFLKLVGFHPLDAQPATVNITFRDVRESVTVSKGALLAAGAGSETVCFQATTNVNLISSNLKAVKTIVAGKTVDNTQANETGGVHFAPFGDHAPEGAEMHLGFDRQLPAVEIHIAFVLCEGKLSLPGSHGNEPDNIRPSVSLSWEYFHGGRWNHLRVAQDETMGFAKGGRVVLSGPSAMDKGKDDLYWLRCRLMTGRYEIVPLIDRVLVNTIPAVQAEAVRNEDLGTGRDIPNQRIGLKRPPMSSDCLHVEVEERDGRWTEWVAVNVFEGSGPEDRHYLYDAAKQEVTFGNGLNGRKPGKFMRIRALYETTLGEKGNVPKGLKFSMKINGHQTLHGENLYPAEGGRDAESIDDVKARARKDQRTPYHAVTSDDYEWLTRSTPGLRIARAKAIPNYSPWYPCASNVPGAVTVVVVPSVSDEEVLPMPGEGFLETVKRHLDAHRLITAPVYVIGPEYVKLSVTCTVHIRKRSNPKEVEKRVRNGLNAFFHPLKGGPDKKGWPFGRSIFRSEIYQLLDGVEGVDYVTDVSVSVEGNHRGEGEVIQIRPYALAASGQHKITTV